MWGYRGAGGSSPTRARSPRWFPAELGDVRGIQLNFLELGSNRASWLQVWRRHRAPGSSPVSPGWVGWGGGVGVPLTPDLPAPRFPQWQVQFDCFPVESGRQVLVSLHTIPDRGWTLNRSHLVPAEPPGEAGGDQEGLEGWGGHPHGHQLIPACSAGPAFTHTWVPEERAIEVWVPEGPALMVRLCHQLALECEELPWPFHQQVLVPGGHRVSLPYEFLVPCLCIEASLPHHDSTRSKRCPFRDQPAAYGPELWSSVRFHDYSASSKDQMAMVLSTSCPLHPRATLCWREVVAEAALCHDIPNSTASEEDQAYTLDKVDVHPQLCFRFSYGNSSHVECPHRPGEPYRSGTPLPWVSTRGLQLHLRLISSIPAAFSASLCQRRGGQCEPEPPLYTVTQVSGVGLGGRHGGDRPTLTLLLLDAQDALGGCRVCPGAGQRLGAGQSPLSPPPAGPGGARPVLLLYSPDSEEHLGLVCALAERLRAGLGCDVRLDLWEAGGLGQAGTVPWLYGQRGSVGRQRGTVLLLWSRGSLGTAGRGRGWVLAYFSRLCSPRDVPRPLRPLPTYRLPRQLPGLMGALRGSPPAPRRCCPGGVGGLLHRLGAREGSPPPRHSEADTGT
uniref:Uncharacterized protein n=1 Tax=Melopsittacus undulatus TaxID=13146 RepID=A0A8V5HA93_MELUD